MAKVKARTKSEKAQRDDFKSLWAVCFEIGFTVDDFYIMSHHGFENRVLDWQINGVNIEDIAKWLKKELEVIRNQEEVEK